MASRKECRPSKGSHSSFVDRLAERYSAKYGDTDPTKVMPVFDPLHDLGQLIIAGRFDLPVDMKISADHLEMLPKTVRKRKNQTQQTVGEKRKAFLQFEPTSTVTDSHEVETLNPAELSPSRLNEAEPSCEMMPSSPAMLEENMHVGGFLLLKNEQHRQEDLNVQEILAPVSNSYFQEELSTAPSNERSSALATYETLIAEYCALRDKHCDVEVCRLLAYHLNNKTLSSLPKDRFDPQSDKGKLVLGGRSSLPRSCIIPPEHRKLLEEKTEEHRQARRAMLSLARKAVGAEKEIPRHQRSKLNLRAAIRWLEEDKYPMWDPSRSGSSNLRQSEAYNARRVELEIISKQPPDSQNDTILTHQATAASPVHVVTTESAAEQTTVVCVTPPASPKQPTAQRQKQETEPTTTSRSTNISAPHPSSSNAIHVSPLLAPAIPLSLTASGASKDAAVEETPPQLNLFNACSDTVTTQARNRGISKRTSRERSPTRRRSNTPDSYSHRRSRNSRTSAADRDIDDYRRYIAEYETLRAKHCDPEIGALFIRHITHKDASTETATTFDPQSEEGRLVLGGRLTLSRYCIIPPEHRRLLEEKTEEHRQARLAMLHVAKKALAAEYYLPAYQRSNINLSKAIYWLEKNKYPMWDPQRTEDYSRHCQQKPRGRSPHTDKRTNTAEHRGRERDERSREREPPSAKKTRYSRREEEEDGKCASYGASDGREEIFESKQTVPREYLDSPLKRTSVEAVKEKPLPAYDLRAMPPPLTLPAAPAAVISTLAPIPASLTTHASALTTPSEEPRANPVVHTSVIDSVRLDLEQMEKMYKEFMSQ